MTFNTKVRVYKCEFLGFADALGTPIDVLRVMAEWHSPFRARVRMQEDHDRMGGRNGEVTITSVIRSIDFEYNMIVTQNSIYMFGAHTNPMQRKGK